MNDRQIPPVAIEHLSAGWSPNRGLVYFLLTTAFLSGTAAFIELISSQISHLVLHSNLRPVLAHWIDRKPVELTSWLHAKTIVLFIATGALSATIALYPSRRKSLAVWLNCHEKIIIPIIFLLYAACILVPFCNPFFFTDPIVNGDHILHYTDGLETKAHLLHHGSVWGFDPFHCGGRMLSLIDNFWQAIFFITFSWLGNPASYNLSVIAAFLIPPMLLYYSSRAFGITTTGRILLALLNCLMMVQYVPIRAFYFVGMTGFIVSSCLCIFCLALTHRYCTGPSVVRMTALIASGTFALLVHPLSAVTFCILFLPYLLTHWKLAVRHLPHLGLMAILPLTAAWYLWLGIHLSAGGSNIAEAIFQRSSMVRYFIDMCSIPPLMIITVFFAVIGVISLKQIKTVVPISGAILFSALFCLILTTGGTQMGLGMIEPPRYVVPFSLLSAILLAQRYFRHSDMPSLPAILPIVLLIALLVPQGGYFGMKFGYGSFPEVDRLVQTLQGKGSAAGRLLIQDINTNWYFGGGFAGSLPFFTSRESNVSPYPYFTPPEFVNDRLFGRPISENTDGEILSWIRLLRVNRIMVYSAEARRRFSALPEVHPIAFNGQFFLFRFDSPDTTRLLRGAAIVEADFDRITIARPCCDTLVLAYHYFDQLAVASPGRAQLFPVFVKPDPSPYVGIVCQGEQEIIIETNAWRIWPFLNKFSRKAASRAVFRPSRPVNASKMVCSNTWAKTVPGGPQRRWSITR